MQRSRTPVWLIVVIAVIVVLCLCIIGLIAVGAFTINLADRAIGPIDLPFDPPPTEPSGPIDRPTVGALPLELLETLRTTEVNAADLRDLTCRLNGVCNVPETTLPPAGPRQVGETDRFWITNHDSFDSIQIDATLRYVTPHVYFWVQNGISYDDGDMRRLVDTFENEIYPTSRAAFGSEWTPGVDGDPHIYILYARGLGAGIAGYFSNADEVHPLAHKQSNGHEMFVFSADTTTLDDEFTYGVLAHEFQHMIQWYQDRNENSWVSEGYSELSAFLNGYDVGGTDRSFIYDPDIQLNDWPVDDDTYPHYGAAFMFVTYFRDRFGPEASLALATHPENDLAGVDAVLAEIGAVDPLTGEPVTTEDFFADWVVANFLRDPGVADGRFDYNTVDLSTPSADPDFTFSSCPDDRRGSVHQFGADYLRVTCPGTHTLRFEGTTLVDLVPAQPRSGNYAFWSNKGDISNMTLTRTFDLSAVSGPVELTFWTWYDIEDRWDFIYLTVSTDNENWQILTTPSGTADDPYGNSYGWGYTGRTGGWIQERIDLSAYAGQVIQVRFEYVTDTAVHAEGMLIDDVAIPAIGYETDFENDDGGWVADGFVRVSSVLPQTYRLSLILSGSGGTLVQPIALDEGQDGEVTFTLGDDYRWAVLVVSGTTRYTRGVANYRVWIDP